MIIKIALAFIIGFTVAAIWESYTGTPSYIVASFFSILLSPFVFLVHFIWGPVKNVVRPCSQADFNRAITGHNLYVKQVSNNIYYVNDPHAHCIWNRHFFVRVK